MSEEQPLSSNEYREQRIANLRKLVELGFKPFGQAMTKIAKRQIATSYEIYLSLYQAVTGAVPAGETGWAER